MRNTYCPYCSSSYGRKKGMSSKGDAQRFECYSCKKQYQVPLDSVVDTSNRFPRILLFDIETSLMKVFVWGLYKQRIPHNNIIDDWYVLSWSAKWLYDDNIISDIVTPKESKKGDDKRVLKSMHTLLDKADIVIAHNGDRFDLRKLNWRFINNDMEPPTPYKSIDTLKVARREFAAPSYKLDFLTKNFDVHTKLKTDFQLWVDCMAGDKARLDEMQRYNKQDVAALEDVYLILRPYIKNHPNLGVLMDNGDVCSTCGENDIDETDAVYFTTASKFLVYKCNSCKTSYIRSKKHINDRNTELRSVAR